MRAQITVQSKRQGAGWDCQVTISESGSQTTHAVRVEEADRDRLAGPAVPVERLVEKSFEFLLAREPKESILRSFALPLIGRYFPEYEREVRKLL